MKLTILTTITLAIAGCASNEAQLASRAKITRPQAESAALRHVRGAAVKSAELEEEHGKLVWSFDLKVPGTRNLTEVHVDAVTGKVIATETETPDDEAREGSKERSKRR